MSANKKARTACADSAGLRICQPSSRTGGALAQLPALLRQYTLLLAITLFAAAFAPRAAADDIDYAYDEAGRLVQATNRTSGEAVRYTYDAAGNITSQISGPITTLAIGHFSPRRGPVGTQVTINGTGFSATPAGNTVRFNSVPATVVSATQSKIVAVVPASATSGPVSVEVAAATVTSAEVFVVTAMSDGPSIDVVLPTVSYSGNIVTIVGANFEPVATQNRVRFNNATAEVLTSTATTITVRVPADAGSGKIRVTTPSGIAVSPTDFIVLQTGTSASGLATIDRVAPDGAGSTVNITAHNTYGVRLFEGKVGDLLSIGLSGMTFPSATIRVHAPDNTVIAQPQVTATAPGVQLPKLTVAGTYAIYVFPSNLGSATVSVYKPSTTSLTLGTPAPVTITPPGRRALLTFSVPADTYADVTLSGVTLSSGTLTLTAPDGVIVKSQTFTNTGLSFQPLLKQAGQYKFLLDPAGSIGGAVTVTVNTSATPTMGSSGLSINNATPTVVTFRAEPNEYLSILTQITSGSSFGLSLVVKTPDGTVFAQRSVGTSYTSSGSQIGSGVLNFGPTPMGGTYTATVQRTSGSSASVSLTQRTAIATPIALPFGSEISGAVDFGQTLITRFDGNAGQFVSLAVTERDGSMRGATAVVLKPDGTQLMSQTFTIRTGAGSAGTPIGGSGSGGEPYRDGTAVVNIGPLPMSGTYRVLLQQSDHAREIDSYSGSWFLTLTNPVVKTIAIDGALDHTRFEINGQGVLYRFTGTAGQFLALGMRTDVEQPSHPNTMDSMAVGVFDPDGNQVATGGMVVTDNYGSGVVNIGPLPASGVYSIFMQQLGYWRDSTGGIEAYLSHAMTASLSHSGSAPMETARMGQGALARFTASAGDHRGVRVETSGHITGSRLRIFAPDGSQLGTTASLTQESENVGHVLVNIGPLAAPGTYTAVAEQTGTHSQNIGTFDISVTTPATGTLHGNTNVDVPLQPGQPLQYTFAATQGSYRSLVVSESDGAISSASVTILDPGGVSLASGWLYAGGSPWYSGRMLLNVGPLPVTGNYSILIKQVNRNRRSPQSDAGLGLTLAAPVESSSQTISVGMQGQAALRTFSGTAGQVVSTTVSEDDTFISNTSIKLLAPNGTVLRTGVMNAARCSGCAGYSGSATVAGGQLPVSGTYGVLVQQTGMANDASGTGVLSIGVTGATPAAGNSSNIATTTSGQYATTAYTVSAGESFSVALTSAAMVPTSATSYSLFVLRPDGSNHVWADCSTANPGCELAIRNVTAGGTYQVQVRPVSNATISGVLTIAPAVTGELVLDTPAAVSLSAMGQAGLLSFATTVKQTLSLSFDSVTPAPANTTMYVTVGNSAGTAVSELTIPGGATINLPELAPDAYFVWIRPQYPATANMQLTLRSMAGGAAPNDGTAVNFNGVSPGQAAYYTFEAQAGESIGVALTNVAVTPTTTDNLARMYVYPPGSASHMDSALCQTTRCGVSLRNLTKSGTYRVAIVPYLATRTVAGTLTVSKAVTGTLTPDQPLAVNLSAPGQPALLSFTAAVGQHFSIDIGGLGATPTGSTLSAAVYDSQGNAEATGTVSTGLSLELPNLPPDNYFVWLTQSLPMAASMQVTLRSMPTLPGDGTSTTFDTAALGQTSYFTFEAQAGESVGVALSNVVATPTTTDYLARMYVYPPGSASHMDSALCQTTRCGVSLRNLAKSGTYRVGIVSYLATRTVAGALTVSRAVAGTLTPNQSVALNLTAPGQPAHFSFTATAGQHFSLNIGGLSATPVGSTVSVTVYDSLANIEASGTTGNGLTLELPALPADTYFVWITQSLPMTGSMQVRLGSMPLLSTDGTSVNFDTATIGQASYYTFNAQAGESGGLALTNLVVTPTATGQVVRVQVYPPGSANALTQGYCNAPSCAISWRNLTQSGTYRVALVPLQSGKTVAGTIAVSSAITASLSPGTPLALNLTQPGQPAVLSFSRAAAQPLSLSISSISAAPAGTSYSAILYNSAGSQVTSGSSASSIALTSASLPAGSYTVWIYSAAPSTATMTVSF